MKITVTCKDGTKRKIGLRAAYSYIKSEKAIRSAVAETIAGYRRQGGAWIAYAEAMEKKDILEQLSLIGMISN